ncbi:MAG TPA: CHAT domain-containing protein [Thermoanaerobaculia bacterium]|nr:CHAT domain-containing protein [Thermoanaerobaculia bacterium]
MNEDAPRHLGAQTMAAFLDGTLAGDEIAAVSEHLGGCDECRTVVAETARFEREEESRDRSRRTWWLAAAAVFAAAVLIIPRTRDPIGRLIDAAPADHRLLAPRLAGFPWAPLQPPSRGASAPDPADLRLTGAAGDVLQETRDKTDAEARHATGVAWLLIGRANESVEALEHAAQTSSDWQPWNDLAAARYATATTGQRPSQLPQALADADQALRLSPKAAAAHFNRALILETMGLQDAARDAWQRYLTLDPSSEWSTEAREHLRRLQPRSSSFDPRLLDTMPPDALVRRFPQDARRGAEGILLAQWADAEAAHDETRATVLLARARSIGDALTRFNSEGLLADAVTAVERADPATRAALAAAHRTYRDARIDYSKRLLGVAEKQFRRAAASFARGGSPMADVASYYAASAAFDQSRGDEGRRQLTELLLRVDARRHRALRAQIGWQLAVCSNAAGDWGSAARYATDSAKLFRSLGEQAHALYMDGLAAMAIEMIGERDLAWQSRVQTFAGLSAAGRQQWLSTIIETSAMTLAATGHPAAAASVVELLAANDLDAAQGSFTSANSARYAVSSGDFRHAQQVLARARAGVQFVADPALRESVRAQIALAGATGRHRGDAQLAIAALDRSIEVFARGEARIDLPDAYLQRARARRAAGDEAEALADYAAALDEVEKQRTTLRDVESRLRFLDIAAQIIEDTVDLRLTRGDVAGAFAVADRARTLIDQQPVNAHASSMAALPAGVLVVEYAVLPRRTVVFCVSRNGIVAKSIEIERRELETQVAAFAERMRRRVPVEEIREEASALRRMLIDPLGSQLAGLRDLIIVPDRQLHALPFAALWNEETKQYLVEEFTLRFAPSAAFSRRLAMGPTQQAALVIADPPAAAYPQLPASREEAVAIAAMYGGATLLAGQAATRTAFLERARGSDVIHFAGHANSDATTSHGALLFAGAGDDSGILGSSEIAQLRLERNPLVVLAACGTLRGSALHVAGMSSLSRAFLIAGARGVVGTLWEVDDDVSAALFRRFHAHLRAGTPPAEALRAAQVDTLRSSAPRLGHPATWSPVELLTDV